MIHSDINNKMVSGKSMLVVIVIVLVVLIFVFFLGYRNLGDLDFFGIQIMKPGSPDIRFIESNTVIKHNIPCGDENVQMFCDHLDLAVKNFGDEEGVDIYAECYSIWIDENQRFSSSQENIIKDFGEGMEKNLLPDELTYFPVKIKNGYVTENYEKPLIGEQQVLLVYVRYKNPKTGRSDNNIFLFQYTIGSSKIGSLAETDYKKVYDRLVSWMSQNGNGDIVKYLKENNPNNINK